MAIAAGAVAAGRATFVLSPWHFYEIGKLSTDRKRELVNVVDQLNASWILDRADLQLLEFLNSWRNLWNGEHKQYAPIGTLPEVGAFLLRSTPTQLANFNLARYVEIFAGSGGAQLLKVVFADQKRIAASNQVSYRNGRYSDAIDRAVQKRYIARLLAREKETGPSLSELNRREAAILQDGLENAKIDFFIEFVGMSELRAWMIESRLTSLHMAGTAVLNENRQVDRQHACAGLAYCDRLVTNDTELLNRAAEISSNLPFAPATAVRPEDFIQQLLTL